MLKTQDEVGADVFSLYPFPFLFLSPNTCSFLISFFFFSSFPELLKTFSGFSISFKGVKIAINHILNSSSPSSETFWKWKKSWKVEKSKKRVRKKEESPSESNSYYCTQLKKCVCRWKLRRLRWREVKIILILKDLVKSITWKQFKQ